MAAKRKIIRLPLVLNGADASTTEGYAVFWTAPHIAWHIADIFARKSDALAEVKRLRADESVDGVAMRRVTFGKITSWKRD